MNVSTESYPDPVNFNLNDTHEQELFLEQYQAAQEHDPQVKYGILIFYAVLLTMISAQSGLFWWKKKHKRSYELVTLLGLWLVPAVVSFYFHFWRFLLVWAIFSVMSGFMFYLCSARRLDRTTPRRVYSWFLGTYNVSVAVGILGYLLLIAELFLASSGASRGSSGGTREGSGRPPAYKFRGMGAVVLWYGLYFGVLGRDAAEVAADRMAALIGTRRQMAVSVRTCGICAGDLGDFGGGVVSAQEEAAVKPPGWRREKTVQLACKHVFHDLCIRGWAIVGKKDTCPTCLEKVDLRSVFADRPWETRNLTWIQMLDGLRYLIVWNPVILLALHLCLHYVLAVDRYAEARHKGDKQALLLMSHGVLDHAGSLGLNASGAGDLNATHALW